MIYNRFYSIISTSNSASDGPAKIHINLDGMSTPPAMNINKLLLKWAKGTNIKDKLVFFRIKNVYLAIAVVSKIVLERDGLYHAKMSTAKLP